jgi:ATP-dependent RNA helicase DDX35
MNVVALHAGLSTADQLAVFQASEKGTRKVVISTNIAEASVTINVTCFVVDSRFVKVKVCSFAAIPHMITPVSTPQKYIY